MIYINVTQANEDKDGKVTFLNVIIPLNKIIKITSNEDYGTDIMIESLLKTSINVKEEIQEIEIRIKKASSIIPEEVMPIFDRILDYIENKTEQNQYPFSPNTEA